ncbi:hypothetical protein SDC9_102535 [bioreactor metagenome]|uniref:Uncharacterized protein n=1 Tax=bioreactor metagenome TaxID=1076179 RepID=A0A645ASL0_9ZZZZ
MNRAVSEGISGQDDDLAGIDQPGAEADDQGIVAGLGLAGFEQGLHGDRDGSRRRISHVLDVAADHDAFRQLEAAQHGIGDAIVRLVGDEDVELVGLQTCHLEGFHGLLDDVGGRPAENLVALHVDLRAETAGCSDVEIVGVNDLGGVDLRAPYDRADGRRIRGADDCGACAIAEQEGGGTIGVVGLFAQHLDADHEHVVGGADAHHRVGEAHPIAEAGAGGAEVGGGRVRQPEFGCHLHCQRGEPAVIGNRTDQDRIDLVGRHSRAVDGLAGCLGGQRQGVLRIIDPAALDDAGALLNPFVRGIDDGAHLGVVDNAVAAGAAHPQNPGVGRALRGFDRRAHFPHFASE